jgi:ribonuclease T2
MISVSIRRAGQLAVSLLLVLVLSAASAYAQDRRQNEAGQFDFYVLALSWSPSYCDASTERGFGQSTQDQQCGPRRYSFVVHGLWPQYEQGFPEFCQVPAPRLDRGVVSSMLDLMPSPRLIFHEWDRHGTCSGLTARSFFDGVRKARAVVKIPPEYLDLGDALTVTPNDVADAFVKSNPGLTRAGVAVSCDSKRLSEVRICMTKDLHFRDCAELADHACRRDTLVMPPVRGG